MKNRAVKKFYHKKWNAFNLKKRLLKDLVKIKEALLDFMTKKSVLRISINCRKKQNFKEKHFICLIKSNCM